MKLKNKLLTFAVSALSLIATGSVFAGDNIHAANIRHLVKPTPLMISFVIIFMVLSVGIGIYATKKAGSAEGFFGGTKSFGPWVIALSSASAIMSAFGFIGGPGLVYKTGFTSIWITFAAGGGFAYAYWIIGKRMRGMAEITDVATLPDIARVRFKSQAVRGLLAVILLLASIAYLSSQVKGGAKLVAQMLGLQSETTAALILFGVTLAFMLFSGMSGSILTDAFQGFVMVLGVLGVLVGFFWLTGGECMEVIQNNPQFGVKFIDAAGKGQSFHAIITFAVVFFVGVLGQPQMLTKMYSLKNAKDLKKAGFYSGLTYAVTSLVWWLVGYGALYIVAKGLAAPLKDADAAAFLYLSKMPGFIQALVMSALLAAIMSTASFFVSVASGAVTRDLMGALGHEIPENKQVNIGRVLTVVVTLGALAFGYWGSDMVAILGTLGWGFFVSGTIPLFLIGMLWRGTTKEGAIWGLIVALVTTIVFGMGAKMGIAELKLPFPYYMLTIATSAFTTVFVSLFTKTAGGDDLPKELEPLFKL